MSILNLIIGMVLAALVAGFVIWIVGRLGLGIEVSGFGPAFIAAIVIAVISTILYWLLGFFNITIGGGLCGGLIYLLVAAAVLLLAGRFVKGLVVKGYVGAIIAAIAIGVVAWLLSWVLSLFGI